VRAKSDTTGAKSDSAGRHDLDATDRDVLPAVSVVEKSPVGPMVSTLFQVLEQPDMLANVGTLVVRNVMLVEFVTRKLSVPEPAGALGHRIAGRSAQLATLCPVV